jgi:hypothetical protein
LNVHCWFKASWPRHIILCRTHKQWGEGNWWKGEEFALWYAFSVIRDSWELSIHSLIAGLTSMFLVQQPEEGTDEWKLLEACKNPKSWVPVHWIQVLENKIAFAQTLRILEDQVSAVKWHFFAGSEIFLILLWISWDWSCDNSRVSRWVIPTFTACCTCFSQLFQWWHQWQLACSPIQHTFKFFNSAPAAHCYKVYWTQEVKIMHKNNWLTQL